MKRFGVIVSAAALCAICCTPALAMAGKKFDTTVKWVGAGAFADGLPDQDLPWYRGRVVSNKTGCLNHRKLVILDGDDEFRINTTSRGRFTVIPPEFGGLPSPLTKVTTAKKKSCKNDSAIASFTLEEAPTLDDFAYDDPTYTFSGSITSDAVSCADDRAMNLYFDDGVQPSLQARTRSGSSGAYIFSSLADEAAPGQWSAQTDDRYTAETRNSGSMDVTGCPGGVSNTVTVGAR